ncbi:uncharacterized protein MYCFIDRAFT_175306 [Pseudocercospora fijiensis CIRAD86]|uniref:Uncharacterized protein n=1 Tax=Pseudocercospora fijiensis (strain CIRAD86) TaxID=383855 RepID=M3AW84_PSEFD|nr:uncharacterized protein MYCFIDRAFT_175306 [Pseudocercospora fijiensis CIRAD86]EME81717.1 hypothetical protein MYCFIDRAFT_175306 [Pseudocercospora fijiensis CIRAD86]
MKLFFWKIDHCIQREDMHGDEIRYPYSKSLQYLAALHCYASIHGISSHRRGYITCTFFTIRRDLKLINCVAQGYFPSASCDGALYTPDCQ